MSVTDERKEGNKGSEEERGEEIEGEERRGAERERI